MGTGGLSIIPSSSCRLGHAAWNPPRSSRSTRCSAIPLPHCQSCSGSSAKVSRRTNLAASILFPSLLILQDNAIAAEAPDEYSDPIDGFRFAVPGGWALGKGATENTLGSASRKIVAVYPNGENPSETNATVVVTTVAADYSKLGSFGTALDFGQNLVNSMDRSYLKAAAWKRATGEVQTARLIDASSKRGMFYIEYNVQRPQEGMKYLASAVAMGTVGMNNRLYTLTLQCPEKDAEKYKPEFNTILGSFTVPALSS